MIRFLVILLLSGCSNYPDKDTWYTEEVEESAPEEEKPKLSKEEAWERRMYLLTKLPTLDEEQINIAIILTNHVLLSNEFESTVELVPVYLRTADEIKELTGGVSAYGWTPGRNIYIRYGENVCSYSDDYGPMRMGTVLSHEMLHTIGFTHDDGFMKELDIHLEHIWNTYCN